MEQYSADVSPIDEGKYQVPVEPYSDLQLKAPSK
jgi:hypothetical protein